MCIPTIRLMSKMAWHKVVSMPCLKMIVKNIFLSWRRLIKGGFSKVDTISADKSDLKNSFKILLNKFETDSESDSEKGLEKILA